MTSGIVYLAESLQNLVLNYESNAMGDSGMKDLSNKLLSTKNLKTLRLYMRNNGIGNQGSQDLGLALKELKNLQSLKLEFSK